MAPAKTLPLLASWVSLAKTRRIDHLNATEMITWQPRQMRRLAIALCPEERGIILVVKCRRENLMLRAHCLPAG